MNMDVICGGRYMKIQNDRYSPSGYSLVADNSGGEYAKVSCSIWNYPMCGERLGRGDE